MFAGVRPVLDPLMLTPLRNAAVRSAWGRGKIDLPPGIAKKLHETPVFVVSDSRDARFRKDLAKALRVERVPEKFRKQELKFDRRDEARGTDRGPDQAARAAEIARRQQQIDQLAGEARRGNAQAKQQVRELERQQRQQAPDQQRAAREQQQAARNLERVQQQANQRAARQAAQPANQQPRGERVGRRAPEPPRAERPQMQRPQPRAERKQEERQAQPQPRFQQRPERVVPNPSKHAVTPPQPQAAPRIRPSAPAAQKHEGNKQPAPPAQPQGQGQGGGKGKGKKP
jgi:hypothetical protein